MSSWTDLLASQLTWHWQAQARPRLDGLTDDEYLWEPVAGMWSVRPRGSGTSVEVGAGDLIIDWAFPPPDPAPVTTIAWRLCHIIIGVFGDRNARYFGGDPVAYDTFDYPARADAALAQLDAAYSTWIGGVKALSDEQLLEPCREVGFESDPMAAMILHIHREAIHHLAEIALLRDLYRARDQRR